MTITDPMHVTKKYVNVLGQLGRLVDPAPGGTTNYSFEPFGHLTTATDNAGNVTGWTYNRRGYLTASSDPDRGSWTYKPDSLGELISQTDANTKSAGFTYDKVSRLTSRSELEGTSSWVWGNSATLHNYQRLSSMSGPGYSETYTYDTTGRRSTVTYVADTAYTVAYAYSPATGFLDNVTYPASIGTPVRIQYAYTAGTGPISLGTMPIRITRCLDCWRQPGWGC